MPGYMNWKQLYKEEFYSMTEEGFDTALALTPKDGRNPLPIPQGERYADDHTNVNNDEKFWEQAYEQLWSLRKEGLRSDFPYVEPITFEDIKKDMSPLPKLKPISKSEYHDRLSGAVNGRIVGVVLGKPLEMDMSREDVKNYLESIGEYPLNDYISGYSAPLDISLRGDCIPSTKGNIHYAQPDDDINYTLLALRLLEKHGLDFTPYHVGENFLDNVPYHWFWCASRQAYYAMVNLDKEKPIDEQVAQIPWKKNPWRECTDGKIKCDLFGYIYPGEPLKAAELAYRDCSFSLAKNGCYGGMFVAGCLSAALCENCDIDLILDCGLAVIPKRSRLYEAIVWVRELYSQSHDYIYVCKKIEERFANMPFEGTINNLCISVLALLHGNLDYTATITTAVSCGIDTDCNGGTAGSICGAAVGLKNIEKRWLEPLSDCVHTTVADIGRIGIEEMTNRIEQLKYKLVPENRY